jgi:cytochrome o ubiquinol oxidase subunit 2
LNLAADKPGTYAGLSGHYSGDGFSDMHFEVQALPADGFSAWVAATRQTGDTLTQQGYVTLSQQSVAVPPFTYRAVDADLFDKIITQALPPGPGPIPETNPGQHARTEH